MGREDLERLSKPELVELVLMLQRPAKTSRTSSRPPSTGVHDFIARRHPEFVRVLPGRRAERSYWIVEHEDTRGIGRIRAVHDALVEAASRDRATFMPR